MKIVNSLLLIVSLGYASENFEIKEEYRGNDYSLADKIYRHYNADKSYKKVSHSFSVKSKKNEIDNEDEPYIEPKIEGYVEPTIIEEPISVSKSTPYLDNALNTYNASQQLHDTGGELLSSEYSKTAATSTSASGVSGVPLFNSKTGFYLGLGITALNYNIVCNCPKRSARGLVIGGMTKTGYNLNQFVGVEVRGMTINLKDNMGTIKHNGLFLKPMLPLGPTTHAYSLVGIAQTKTAGKIRKIDAINLAVGAGVELGNGKGLGAFVDYERLIIQSDAPSLDTVTTGVSFGF